MKAWRWINETFGTPQTGEDWTYFIVMYGVVPLVVIWLLKITL